MIASVFQIASRKLGSLSRRMLLRLHRNTGWRLSSRISVSKDASSGTLRIRSGGERIFLARPERIELQSAGILRRQEFLFEEYTRGKVDLRPGDIVLDCGANIGEFAVASQRRGAIVHAFEPDPKEYRALQMNAADGIVCVNAALWKTETKLEFFLQNSTGDSSLFRPAPQVTSVSVDAIRLDDYLDRHLPNRTIRLLKLEAEGAEPEVLEGAEAALERIEFIAADVGPERGLEKATTLVDVVNALVERQFRLVSFNSERCTLVLGNTRTCG